MPKQGYFMRPLLFLFLFSLLNPVFSQTACNLVPINNYGINKQVLKANLENLKTRAESVPIENKKIKSELLKSVESTSKGLSGRDASGYFMHDDTITKYLDKILARIVSGSKELERQKFLISTYRTSVPNACSYGSGLIFVNLDLITKMKNEAQLAYIICHEISHDVFEHPLKSEITWFEIFLSKEYKKNLNRSPRFSYNKKYSREKVYEQFLTIERAKSRSQESEADSMALYYFRNAGYNPYEALASLNALDSSDYSLFTKPLPLETIFNLPDKPFKKSWLENTTSGVDLSKVQKSLTIPDSLKTHPDCRIRMDAVSRILKKEKMQAANSSDTGPYAFLKEIARREELEILMSYEDYGQALFNALQIQQDDNNCRYIKYVIANCVYEIYKAKKNHAYTEVAEPPSDEFEPNYNTFLVFLENINSASLLPFLEKFRSDFMSYNVTDKYSAYMDFLMKNIDAGNAEMNLQVKEYEKQNSNADVFLMLKKRFNVK